MEFTCAVNGPEMRCAIMSDQDLIAPVFCFSCMAPVTATMGGEWLSSTGGYTEVQLPDLKAGTAHHVVLRHKNIDFSPANRAWLPLGTYLRHADGCIELPPLPAGAQPWTPEKSYAFDGLRVLPQPTEWVASAGTLGMAGIAVNDDAFAAAHALGLRLGMPGLVVTDGTPVALIHDATLPMDAYRIVIADDGIDVAANGYGGRFYAAVTLLTLRATHDGQLPCGTITDTPRFDWRGQHLDSARHFFAPETIHRLLDVMALCKLNRFHWHFADDEAFRLQLDCLPELWQQTQMRGEGQLMPGVFGGGISAGGSYSKDDVTALIAHAKTLNIEVMPEIEVPAHALALTRVYPDTRDPGDTGTEVSVQGYAANAMNPAMPRTWEVLEALVDEVTDLFPFDVLHLGCDELPPETWMGSPAARVLMQREGLANTKDLQGWTMSKLAAQLAEKSVRPAAWEEAAQGSHGGIGHNALLFSWSGQGPGIVAARAGYDVVMTPAQNVYLDMAHTDDPDDWGANWAAYVALEDTILWDPVPTDAQDIADRIKGVQGAFWSEFTTLDDQLWPMILPRILGVAAKAWQTDGHPAVDDLHHLATYYHTAGLLG